MLAGPGLIHAARGHLETDEIGQLALIAQRFPPNARQHERLLASGRRGWNVLSKTCRGQKQERAHTPRGDLGKAHVSTVPRLSKSALDFWAALASPSSSARRFPLWSLHRS